jgi:hypothetical protein
MKLFSVPYAYWGERIPIESGSSVSCGREAMSRRQKDDPFFDLELDRLIVQDQLYRNFGHGRRLASHICHNPSDIVWRLEVNSVDGLPFRAARRTEETPRVWVVDVVARWAAPKCIIMSISRGKSPC